MPGLSKRQAKLRLATSQRYPKENIPSESEGSNEDDSKMDADFQVDNDDDEGELLEKFDLNDIGDLLELCRQQGNLQNIVLLLYTVKCKSLCLVYRSTSWKHVS